MGVSPEPLPSRSPSEYRRENSHAPPPAPYKPPSMLKEHRVLALAFAALSVALAVYTLHERKPASTARTGRPAAAARPAQSSGSAQPVYIETLPGNRDR